MNVDPAIGKILGMLMAYGVSALGLLLAYYNYRKRVVKASQVFTPAARAVLWWAGLLLLLIVLLAAAAATPGHASAGEAIRAQLPGLIIPGALFALSFWVTWRLYKRFTARRPHDGAA